MLQLMLLLLLQCCLTVAVDPTVESQLHLQLLQEDTFEAPSVSTEPDIPKREYDFII